jgi:hypothetical protein
MKLINYNYGYNNTFNCSIHGKIVVTKNEWSKIVKYLLHNKVTIFNWDFEKRILKDDLQRKKQLDNINTWYNLRVSATDLVVWKFNIKGYKRGNYVFCVKG